MKTAGLAVLFVALLHFGFSLGFCTREMTVRTQRFKSAADYATAEIRHLIMAGDLVPGSRLDQENLAEKLDVSRHPVRQALERLSERGFVELSPNRSARVAELSVADMTEIYDVRQTLEASAVGKSFARYGRELVQELEDLDAEMTRALGENKYDPYMEANRSFHLKMYEDCGNRYLFRTIVSLFDLSERYQRTSLQQPGRLAQSSLDHRAMIAAIKRNEKDELIRLILHHNALTQEAVRLLLDKQR
jgi:DNA-binding GntR family transcriptional regulator